MTLATCQAQADALPLPDAQFDLVATRFSAHHWPDVLRALLELRRVARPGGHLLLIDLLGDDSPVVDTHLQAIELIRDPGHARDLTVAEWQVALRAAAWRCREFHSWPVRIAFDSWVERMQVQAHRMALLREMQDAASAQVRQALTIEADGSFTARVGLFVAVRD
jgi:SAM-dependent methyltransferase